MSSLDQFCSRSRPRAESLEVAIEENWTEALMFVLSQRCEGTRFQTALDESTFSEGLNLARELSELSHMSHCTDEVLARRENLQVSLSRWTASLGQAGLRTDGEALSEGELAECLCDVRVLCEWLWDVDFFAPVKTAEERRELLGEAPLTLNLRNLGSCRG